MRTRTRVKLVNCTRAMQMSCDDNQFHSKRITRKIMTLFSANIIRMCLCVCVTSVILLLRVCIYYYVLYRHVYLRRKFAHTNIYIPMLIARSQGVSEIKTLLIA